MVEATSLFEYIVQILDWEIWIDYIEISEGMNSPH